MDDYSKFEKAGGRIPLKIGSISEDMISTPTHSNDRNNSEMTSGLRLKIDQAEGATDMKD